MLTAFSGVVLRHRVYLTKLCLVTEHERSTVLTSNPAIGHDSESVPINLQPLSLFT